METEVKQEIEKSDYLCSVYCPVCDKVTDRISFNLLKAAGRLTAFCPECENITFLTYNGKDVTIRHIDYYKWEKINTAGK
jgi:Zn finger protein HypA/HybF involved in hydrogenase expression